MKIFEHELLDGLGESLKCNSVAMHCAIEQAEVDIPAEIKAIASCDDNDLYGISSVLVSAGWNKNDDVFPSADLWSAKDTPVNKPINNQHVSKDVIGHMTQAMIMTRDGMLVAGEDELTEDIDIIVHGVIYKSWTDADQRDKVEQLIAAIEANKKFVSMECSFPHFDYAIISPKGEHQYIERDAQSSFLTKYLRAYGGSGEFEGYKIGRMLRDFRFIGKGVVDKPGNPRSVILAKNLMFKPAKADLFFTSAEVSMDPKDLEKANADNDRLTADLKSAQNEINQLKASQSDLEKTLSDNGVELEKVKTDLEEVRTKLTAAVTELETAKADLESANADKVKLTEEVTVLANEIKTSARVSALSEKGVDPEKIDEIVAKFDSVDDEVFEAAIALIVPKKVEETKTEAEATDDEGEEDEDEPEAKLEVEEDSKAGFVDHTETKSFRDHASAFIRTVLNSTPKE